MDKDTDPSYPPLAIKYAHLLHQQLPSWLQGENNEDECELPLIELNLLTSQSSRDRQICSQQIFHACSQWGFFQAINHGVPPNMFEKVKLEARKLFSLPFQVKKNEVDKVLPYTWGTPARAELKTPNWMENFHLSPYSLKAQSSSSVDEVIHNIDFSILSVTMEEYERAIGTVACQVLGALASEIDLDPSYFTNHYSEADSFFRLNRYPPCKRPGVVHGMEPHTDSDLLTLIHQDHVGGLQILRNQKWVNVKPRQDALIINIGDLLQAWSNDVYQSVKHKVTVKCKEERISVGYFVFPDVERCILIPHENGRHYRGFTPKDFRAQVDQDIQLTGSKIGLPHFRIPG